MSWSALEIKDLYLGGLNISLKKKVTSEQELQHFFAEIFNNFDLKP